MGFTCGIVGLPNVGKSTLFNSLTRTSAAQAANYAFTTVEPNVGCVAVPDTRLHRIARLAKSATESPSQIEFVDIAGLVRGASHGEGLGNRFLGHIHNVDAILHVVRCFEEVTVTHVLGRVDPVADAELVETELLLADLERMERRTDLIEKQARCGDKDARAKSPAMRKVLQGLRAGTPAAHLELGEGDRRAVAELGLLTGKPLLYVCNVGEPDGKPNRHAAHLAAKATAEGRGAIELCAAMEAELAALRDEAERREYAIAAGADETGLNRMIRAGYALLDLVTFFTAGPVEARAWTIRRGTKLPQAAGCIHSDMERGFIRAEVIPSESYIACGGDAAAKGAGRMRVEGKEYIVQDGDVLFVRFNV